MSSPVWKCALAAAALVLVSNVDARAQICGDADNSGAVTVTDGVQALRAAAGLSSSCSNATCDVDGSGSVTVTDGVNVLRKAAGIAITEACGGGGLNAQVQELLKNTVPIFGGLTKIGTAQGARAAGTGICENSDGSAVFDPDFNEFDFDNCLIGGLFYDGSLALDDTGTTLSFDIGFTDPLTDEGFDFSGDLSLRANGQNSVIGGSLDVFFDDLGFLTVNFEDIESDPNGNFVGGSFFFDTSDSDIEGVSGLRVGLNTSNIAPVSVFLTDQTQLDFNFDLVTGDLTPVSN
jgi:hypothetical protein